MLYASILAVTTVVQTWFLEEKKKKKRNGNSFTHDTLRSCTSYPAISSTPSSRSSPRTPTRKVSPRPWTRAVCAAPSRNSACPWPASSHAGTTASIADCNPGRTRRGLTGEGPSDPCIPDCRRNCCFRHGSYRSPPFPGSPRYPPCLPRLACPTSTRLRRCFLKQCPTRITWKRNVVFDKIMRSVGVKGKRKKRERKKKVRIFAEED